MSSKGKGSIKLVKTAQDVCKVHSITFTWLPLRVHCKDTVNMAVVLSLQCSNKRTHSAPSLSLAVPGHAGIIRRTMCEHKSCKQSRCVHLDLWNIEEASRTANQGPPRKGQLGYGLEASFI